MFFFIIIFLQTPGKPIFKAAKPYSLIKRLLTVTASTSLRAIYLMYVCSCGVVTEALTQ